MKLARRDANDEGTRMPLSEIAIAGFPTRRTSRKSVSMPVS